MQHIRNYLALWASGSVIVLYLLFYFLTDIEISKFGADWLALIGMGFMSVVTLPAAWAALKQGIRDGADQLIFSYWLIWTTALVHRTYIIIFQLMGSPQWVRELPIAGLIGILFAITAGFGMLAPVSGPEKLARREIITTIIASTFSGIIAGITIGVYIIAGWVNN